MTSPFHHLLAGETELHTFVVFSETAPTTTRPGLGWFKESTAELFIRNSADTAWHGPISGDQLLLLINSKAAFSHRHMTLDIIGLDAAILAASKAVDDESVILANQVFGA